MMKSTALLVEIDHYPFINFTFVSNRYNFIKRIIISGIEEDLHDVKISLSTTFGLFEKYIIHFDKLNKDQILELNDFPFKFDLEKLRGIAERDVEEVSFEIHSGDELLYEYGFTIDILPIDYFGGLGVYPQLLSSYILPNHSLIYKLKSEVIEILESQGHKVSFEGYQTKDKERVLQMVSAMFRAIQSHEIVYSAMPPSFEKTGQRIRLLDKVIETKFGNCIDLSLLFASLLEAIDLNPIIVLTSGHAFVGVWLEDHRFDSMINYDVTALTKRMAIGIKQIALIETTHLCRGNHISFSDAINSAERQLLDEENFILSIDVKNARSYGIHPLPIGAVMENSSGEVRVESSNGSAYTVENEFNLGETYEDLELTDLSQLTKQKVWERKLLDLSLRNNLLNLRFTKSMLQIVDLKSHLLEDNLAEGKTYTIHPNNNLPVTRKYNAYFPPLHHTDSVFKLADDEFAYNRLLTYYHNDDLNTILTHLFRTSRQAEEESGKSTLYLGIGLLKWYEPRNKSQPRFAPLLLIPVELSRRSVNSKYTLRSREEETMINITLLEYLKQEYKLNLNNLENLPMDEFGVDVPKVLAIFRNAVMSLEGWDVLEQTVLGIFSFNKLILWRDIAKHSEEIERSPIVKSLIEGKLSASLESIDYDETEMEHLSFSSLTLPISTDNSQLNAVKSANANKTFILHGPPGTGKSQTITNIIADALANDKKVLFVAAKKAALDVVHQRLENIGLGPFCLELHSNKSKKSDVLLQFERVLNVPKYQTTISFQEEAERLDERRKELNKYVSRLHEKNKIGWSIYDTISYLEYYGVHFENEMRVPIDFDRLDSHQWKEWQSWISSFGRLISKLGVPKKHPLHSVKKLSNQFDLKDNMVVAINSYLEAKMAVEEVSSKYELELSKASEYLEVFNFVQNNEVIIDLIDYVEDEVLKSRLEEWRDLNAAILDLKTAVSKNFNHRILDYNYQEIQMEWNQSQYTWFIPKWLKQRKVKKVLQGFSSQKISSPALVSELFDQLDKISVRNGKLKDEKFAEFSSKLERYLNVSSVSPKFQEDVHTIEKLLALLENLDRSDSIEWIKRSIQMPDFHNEVALLIQLLSRFADSSKQLSIYLNEIPTDAKLSLIIQNIQELDDWIIYKNFEAKSNEIGSFWFIEKVNEEVVDVNRSDSEFEKLLRVNHFIQSIYGTDELKGFNADVYESQIQQYRELHQQFIELSKNQLIAKLSSRIPNLSIEAAQSSEIGILQKAIRSRGRGITIRRLFDQIPTLIPRLKPCMLMSPISVAQYFDVNQDHFDLVIFDEASQLPTAEAISALARAKQTIIVGDPKQMPPTSFFTSTRVDEENIEIEDLESILEDTLALSIPSNHLLRHYRSKHESLISFSNKNFYDSKLLTFPSPDDLNQKVSFEFVKGFYDKGKTRTNRNEALRIIEYIKNHLETQNQKSLGVITFSQVQQGLIEDLLQKLFQEYGHLEEFALQYDEPIFIKNLENVQGDERDIILFSICYGPDEEEKISMNFGPLNREGGWRRLNVAVTRARYEMKVFSSLKGDQIDLNRTKAEGVRGLKEFLSFAEKGDYVLNHLTAEPDKISMIETIEKELEKHDLAVRKYIGTSNYKVDLGIINPKNDQEYILGILVDGKNYHNIHTTNDRELLTPNVLKGLGWNIYRVWTLDWLRNKEKCIDEIKQLIQDIIENKLIVKKQQISSVPELKIQEESLGRKISYEIAELEAVQMGNSESIYFLENRSLIMSQMAEIIKIEAPISKSLLFRKVMKLWSTARAGNKLNNYLSEIADSLSSSFKTQAWQEFYWNATNQPDSISSYRDNSIEKRSIEDIAPEEISVAIMEIMEVNLSLEKEDLIRLVARAFGFQKVGAQIEAVINQVLGKMLNEKRLSETDNRFKMNRFYL